VPIGDESDIEAQVRAAEIDRLASALAIYRRRGQLDEARKAAEDLSQLQPGNVDARELGADILMEQGRVEEALDEYRAILGEHPEREHSEEMVARISVILADRERLKAQQRDILEAPEKMPRDRTARAVACALLLPGLGQLYLGQYMLGVVLLIVTLAATAVIANYGIAEPFTVGYKSGSLGDIGAHIASYSFLMKSLLVVSLVAIMGAYLYGLIDAVRVARRQREAVERELGIS
jgi:tetratricopeptide (TPR) repeat protein